MGSAKGIQFSIKFSADIAMALIFSKMIKSGHIMQCFSAKFIGFMSGSFC